MALRDMTDCAVSKRRRHNDKRTKNAKFNKRQSKKVHGPFNSSEPSESPLPGRTRTLGSGHASVTLPRARRKQRTEASSAGRGFAALLSSLCLKGTRRPVCVCAVSHGVLIAGPSRCPPARSAGTWSARWKTTARTASSATCAAVARSVPAAQERNAAATGTMAESARKDSHVVPTPCFPNCRASVYFLWT